MQLTELPIVQAPMAGCQGSALAIAVARAGGLGSLPAALLAEEALRAEVAAFRAAVDAPLNLNFFCHAEPRPDPARDAAWRAVLAPYYAELGVDEADIPTGPGRRAFDEGAADLLEELRPEVVSFHFGLPSPELLARVDATVLSTATTVDEARWLEANGADVVIAQGVEAGGHRGTFLGGPQPPTSELVRGIVAAVSIPVIAAGGLAGLSDALALGAAGLQAGSAYLLCPEATTRAVHRAAIGGETAITNVFTGRRARGIVNRAIRELGPIGDLVPEFPLAANAMTPLRAAAEARGLGDFSPLWCGASAAPLAIPAAEVTSALAGA